MSKYYWIVNLDRCVGCETCVIACKQENNLLSGVQYRKLHQVNPEQYPDYPTFRISRSCQHCEKPACLQGCPVAAYEKRDGIVVHDPAVCLGCKYCLWVCPYDAPQYVPAKGKVEKCNLCIARRKRNLQPACVEACPTEALKLVETLPVKGVDDLLAELQSFQTHQTRAKVRFINTRRLESKRRGKP